MAEITTALVKELREITNAGLMACKNALMEAEGEIEKAIDILREKGQAQAVKKASRIAAEGIVYAEVEEDKDAVIIEVNCETDFVAKTDKFRDFVKEVAGIALKSDAKDVDELLSVKSGDVTLNEELIDKIATIGEKISVRRFSKINSDGVVVSYIHGGGRIGVLVEAEAEDTDEVKEALKNVCLQVASMSPRFVSRDDVSEDFIESEKQILIAAAKNDPANAKKPDNIIEKMITGRLNKELKEFCLLEQVYVKDGDCSVEKYLKSVGDIKIKSFVRYETGEGIEKRQENFAEEVAKQIG